MSCGPCTLPRWTVWRAAQRFSLTRIICLVFDKNDEHSIPFSFEMGTSAFVIG